MNKFIKNSIKTILSLIFLTLLVFQGTIDVFAISTKFDVPDIEQDWTPENCLYKSPNLNIQVCNWSYGLVADVLNTSNMDALISELHANVSPGGYRRAVLGMYMEGAGLSAANASAIANAGWTEVDLYYDTFFIGGSAPTAAMNPSVVKTVNESAMTILAEAGITDNVAMFSVSDVNMAWAGIIIYEPEFKFLRGKSLYSYKFMEELGVFVPIAETYFGSYGTNFLEVFDLQKAEATIDGTYVTLTQSLSEELVVSAEEVDILRESQQTDSTADTIVTEFENTRNPETGKPVKKQEKTVEDKPIEEPGTTEESRETAGEKGAEEEQDIVNIEKESLFNSEKTVEWKFAGGHMPDGFTTEATVKALSKNEVSVEFSFSGALPKDTEVTIEIPDKNIVYDEGSILYFYYCNPENGNREYVSEGRYKEKKVTFTINHCSAYVITDIGTAEAKQAEQERGILPVVGILMFVLLGIVGFEVFKKKKM